eukprot:COSAG01_NODE_4745_length_4770_cov_28.401627_6_plen_100_part_00
MPLFSSVSPVHAASQPESLTAEEGLRRAYSGPQLALLLLLLAAAPAVEQASHIHVLCVRGSQPGICARWPAPKRHHLSQPVRLCLLLADQAAGTPLNIS